MSLHGNGNDEEEGITVVPTVVEEGSAAASNEFYRSSVRSQNRRFGAAFTAIALACAVYLLAGAYVSPSFTTGEEGVEDFDAGSGEVGLDADNAKTQEIIDEEIEEEEEKEGWGKYKHAKGKGWVDSEGNPMNWFQKGKDKEHPFGNRNHHNQGGAGMNAPWVHNRTWWRDHKDNLSDEDIKQIQDQLGWSDEQVTKFMDKMATRGKYGKGGFGKGGFGKGGYGKGGYGKGGYGKGGYGKGGHGGVGVDAPGAKDMDLCNLSDADMKKIQEQTGLSDEQVKKIMDQMAVYEETIEKDAPWAKDIDWCNLSDDDIKKIQEHLGEDEGGVGGGEGGDGKDAWSGVFPGVDAGKLQDIDLCNLSDEDKKTIQEMLGMSDEHAKMSMDKIIKYAKSKIGVDCGEGGSGKGGGEGNDGNENAAPNPKQAGEGGVANQYPGSGAFPGVDTDWLQDIDLCNLSDEDKKKIQEMLGISDEQANMYMDKTIKYAKKKIGVDCGEGGSGKGGGEANDGNENAAPNPKQAGGAEANQNGTAPGEKAGPAQAEEEFPVKITDGQMFEVLEQLPHSTSSFTQGLSYADGVLYETTGLNGRSKVMQIDPNSGEVLLSKDVPRQYFGEGMTFFRDDKLSHGPGEKKLIEITWKNKKGFIYDATTLEVVKEFEFSTTPPNHEGWGITLDEPNNQFIVSDGTQYLYFWDKDTLEESKPRVSVTRQNGSAATKLNELEFIDGLVYANVWYSDNILGIDPETGRCVKEYDFSMLWSKEERQAAGADVLNGIAKVDGDIIVTGKNWNRMYKIKLTG